MKPHIHWTWEKFISHITCYRFIYFIENWCPCGARYGARFLEPKKTIITIFHLRQVIESPGWQLKIQNTASDSQMSGAVFLMPIFLLAKNEKILKMANRYKIPILNVNVNDYLCG